MKISVLGATGYAGAELLRLLTEHPAAEIRFVTSESHSGHHLDSVYPHLSRLAPHRLTSGAAIEEIAVASDVVVAALPAGQAMTLGRKVTAGGARLIDLGADYRFHNPAVYEEWYKRPHLHPEADAAYGLTELYRSQVRGAAIVGNPGCYTTASILALAPLVKYGLIEAAGIVVDAKSGLSGAGRSLSLASHFCEAGENVEPYGVPNHRHTPEIEQALSELAGEKILLTFTPHLVPMARGLLSTCYGQLKAGVTGHQVTEAFHSLYGSEPFIRLRGNGYPATKDTRGSNFCDLGWQLDQRTGRAVAVAALDNLGKGAAGQAVQNLNVMFGLDERTGLRQPPLYP